MLKTGLLLIKNPWGVNGWYNPITAKGPDTNLPKNATTPPWYNMTNGLFTTNLNELVKSNLLTLTLPIERDPKDTKKLAEKAQKSEQNGQINSLQTAIKAAELTAAKTADAKEIAAINAVLQQAHSALLELMDAAKTTKDCQTEVCLQTLADAQVAFDAAADKLANIQLTE